LHITTKVVKMPELQGKGIPSNDIGVNGQQYVRQTPTGVVLYIKANGRWNKVSGGDSSASGVTSVNGQTGVVTLALGDLDGVSVPSPSDGEVLTYNLLANSWVASTPSPSGIQESFESVNKNLQQWDYAITYNVDDSVDEITYTSGLNTIVKTFGYTGDKITTITLSGDTPAGIDLIKTLTYTGDKLTSIAYT
jgi:hypothetical protein